MTPRQRSSCSLRSPNASSPRWLHDPAELQHKQIAPAEYFRGLAGIEVPADGLVSCPSAEHIDSTTSCHVGTDADEGWCCHGCGARGAIYDLASVLIGGPTGRWLRSDHFRRARSEVRRRLGAM